MPRIVERRYFNGAEERIRRLGLTVLVDELETILTSFELLVKEIRDSNGAAEVRRMIDERFVSVGGWHRSQTGDVDHVKCHVVNGTRVCLGVEIQMSARSDLLLVDVVHLREQIERGDIDVGVVAVPSNALSVFLTDRAPSYADALKAVARCRADSLPLVVLAIEHDGPGPALKKQRTRQGRDRGAQPST